MEIPDIRRKRAARIRTAATPGKLAAGISLAAAALFGGYTASSSLGPAAADPAAAGSGMRLSEVARTDYAAALSTMNDRDQFSALARDDKSCQMHLAYVTVQRDPDQPAPTGGRPISVRIISGPYVSPVFALGDAPMRVAIPYPGPFSAGQGPLRVVSGGPAVISGLPAWHVAGGESSAIATWAPGPDCERPF